MYLQLCSHCFESINFNSLLFFVSLLLLAVVTILRSIVVLTQDGKLLSDSTILFRAICGRFNNVTFRKASFLTTSS